MSLNNYNWVCFECRFAAHRPAAILRVPKCSECGAECNFLGSKVEIPKKSDVQGWETLGRKSRMRKLALAEAHALRRVQQIHEAERRIVQLRSRGPSKDREKLILELKKMIQAYKDGK